MLDTALPLPAIPVLFLVSEKIINSVPCLLPYFSIDDAHLMYNAHPKLFDVPFDVSITRMTYFLIDNAHDAN